MTWVIVIIGWWVFCGLLVWRLHVVGNRRERQEGAQTSALGSPVIPFPACHGGKSSVMPAEHGRVVALRHGGHSA